MLQCLSGVLLLTSALVVVDDRRGSPLLSIVLSFVCSGCFPERSLVPAKESSITIVLSCGSPSLVEAAASFRSCLVVT